MGAQLFSSASIEQPSLFEDSPGSTAATQQLSQVSFLELSECFDKIRCLCITLTAPSICRSIAPSASGSDGASPSGNGASPVAEVCLLSVGELTAVARSVSGNSIQHIFCCLQLSLDLKELDSPEELYPLKDALERAKRRVDQSTNIREALEAEVSLCPTL